MSPSESELRAALRAGAGERPDADAIMQAAVAGRRQRRARVTGIAASVVVVAGVAVVATVLGSRGSSNPAGAPMLASGTAVTSPAGPAPSAGSVDASAPGGPDATGGPVSIPRPSATPASSCPSTAPSIMTPGGALPAQSGGLLFPDAVTSLAVCVYNSPLETTAGAFVTGSQLNGTDAAGLVSSLESLPTQPVTACGDTVGRTVAIFATAPNGNRTEVVGSASGCGKITNGTAIRYGRDLLLSLAGGPGSGQTGVTVHPGPGPS